MDIQRQLRRFRAGALMLAAWPALVFGQTLAELPSAGVACLTPALADRAQVEYPEQRLLRKDGAFFHLELRFTEPDRPPSTRVVEVPVSEGQPPTEADFVDAAVRYARQLRMPCLAPGGEPVTLRQTFHFVPNDGRRVSVSVPANAEPTPGQRSFDCLAPVRGESLWPAYPRRALERGLQGSVIARLRIESADRAPEITILAEPNSSSEFGRELRRAVQNLRSPCHEGPPVQMGQIFTYRIQDGRRVLLRDMTLRQLAGFMKSYPAPAYFDTGAMQCPFDLRVQYLAPYLGNRVWQIGTPVAERVPLMTWLQKVELDLDDEAANMVLGDSFTLTVPCIKLDLQP